MSRAAPTTDDPAPGTRAAKLYFDVVDPISYLLDRELGAAEAETGCPVERIGIEISPPPNPLGAPSDAVWGPRWDQALAIPGAALARPAFVPWSRKAHELLTHAAREGREWQLRAALFGAFLEDGKDVGRVDVLVELARAVELDPSEVKAVLDVDKYGAEVAQRREDALRSGIRVIPTIVVDGHRLEGFRNRASLSTFLRGPTTGPLP